MIIILGTPGAGKTTQTKCLAQYLDCRWFSMGDLIRKRVNGKELTDMLAGKIISDEVTLRIVDEVLNEFNPATDECVFEGNPRSLPQAKWWLAQQSKGRFKIEGVIHLVADLTVAETRLDKRGRLDDHDDNVVETRFAEYKRSINPTLKLLESKGVAIHEVDANGTIEEVSRLIHKDLGV
jgi:adenylate kinase family enzyme